MKRILPAAVLLLLLAGCSMGTQNAAESAPAAGAALSASEAEASDLALTESAVEPAPMTAETAADPETDGEAAALEASEVQETPEVSEIPAEPEVWQPTSLRDVLPAGPVVKADGTELESLSGDGVTLVQDTVLMTAYPWLTQVEGDGDYPAYTDRYGNVITLSWEATDGTDFTYSGSGGVCFEGEGLEYWLPLREVTELLGLELLWDGEWGEAFVTTPLDTTAIAQGVSIPVLMYHETSDDLWGISSLFVSPDNLRQQLQYLQENGYEPIFFSDLTHIEDYEKPVLITCDDGYIGNYTYLYPLLKEFNMKATIFVITGMVGEEHYMSADQIRELSDSGLVDIQSHTLHHYQLATISAEEQAYEMSQSRLELARITGKVPYVLAYPNGSNDSNTRTLGPDYYTFGVLMNGGIWTTGGDWFGVTRSYVNRDTDLSGFAALLG